MGFGPRQPVIELFLDDEHRNRASYWLPELVFRGHTDEGQFWITPGVKWMSDGEAWRFEHLNEGGLLFVAGEVRSAADGWHTALTVQNRSDKSWPNVAAAACLLLSSAIDYADSNRSRTYYRTEGRFQTFGQSSFDGGQEVYRMSRVKGVNLIERSQRHMAKWGFTRTPSDDGVIAVMHASTHRILTVTWESVNHLQANAKPAFACIHANPGFGPIAPGKSSTVKGSVLITDGNLETAWAKALRSVGRG